MISIKIVNPGKKYPNCNSNWYVAVITVGGMEIDCANWNYDKHSKVAHYEYSRVLEWCEKLVKEFAKNGIDVEHSGIYIDECV